MDQTSSRNRANSGLRGVSPQVGQTDPDSLIDALDTDDGDNAAPVGGAGDTSPRLRTQEPRKSFFSFLNPPERPEDALVKLEAKRIDRYLPQLIKLEQDLGKILKELQELNKLLRAATTDGNQTALETAASKVEVDLAALHSEMSNPVQNASGSQATSAKPGRQKLQESLTKNWTAYHALYSATQNRSKSIDDRFKALAKDRQLTTSPVKPRQVTQSDGSEGDSDCIVSCSGSDSEDS